MNKESNRPFGFVTLRLFSPLFREDHKGRLLLTGFFASNRDIPNSTKGIDECRPS